MELTFEGYCQLNALIDNVEKQANEGVFGNTDKGGYLDIKSSVLRMRQTLKTESDFDPDGGNAA